MKEAELAMMRRLGVSEQDLLVTQGNLAISYRKLGRLEQALCMRREVYSGTLKLCGKQHNSTFMAANNYASDLVRLKHLKEAKSLLRTTMPVARHVLGESNELTLKMRWSYAVALYRDPGATLDDLREAVTTLEETERTARRVMGGAHPFIVEMEPALKNSRAALRAREATEAPPLK